MTGGKAFSPTDGVFSHNPDIDITGSFKNSRMKQSKDPFERAFEEQEESSPPISPSTVRTDIDIQIDEAAANGMVNAAADDDNYDEQEEDDDSNTNTTPRIPRGATSSSVFPSSGSRVSIARKPKEDDEEEEENMDAELAKLPSSGDPDKMAKMQAILSQFTDKQMSRYESFRRAGFQKATMRRLLASIIGTQKISVPLTIVVSGIAKMFVGDLVETARVVMSERTESGPIRPCHVREAYRRLKLEGKVPKRSVPRFFR